MKANEILEAIRLKYSDKAMVPEVVLDVDPATMYDRRDAHLSDPLNVKREPPFRRIDALMFDGAQRTAIEVKTSKADVKRETEAKVFPWKRVTHRFIYAMPVDLIDLYTMNEYPHALYGCGIWWVHEDGRIEVARNAKINKYPESLPQQVITALAYRATPKSFIKKRGR